jgi:hypothetical protein
MSNSTQKAVTARITTIFKNHPVGSQDLEPSEKTLVQAGTRLPVSAITPDRFQHVKLQLVTPILASFLSNIVAKRITTGIPLLAMDTASAILPLARCWPIFSSMASSAAPLLARV